MKISIITPVYNALTTLSRCRDSILSQTYGNIEWIVVDDCSTDGCSELVRGIAKVVMMPSNQGVAAARNAGLDAATGEYIYFVDADDWIEPDTIDKLVWKAESDNLDIVGCEWRLCFEKSERLMRQQEYVTPVAALTAMLCGTMRWNLWLFMSRRVLWEDIRFTPGQNMGEDLNAMFRLFIKAGKVGSLDEYLYHYDQPGISKEMSESNISQVTYNVSVVEHALAQSKYADELLSLVPQLKLSIKLPLLISDKIDDFQKWKVWFPESKGHEMDNHLLPLRKRLLMWCASHELWMCVRIHYWVVIKCVYGLIYR